MAHEVPGTALVYVADREADLMPVMHRAQHLDRHPNCWSVIRKIAACQIMKNCSMS